MSRSLPLCPHRLADGTDRANLNAADSGRRNTRGDLDRLVEIARLDHVEASEKFLRLGEGAVGHRYLAVAHSNRRRGGDRLQRLRGNAMPALFHLFVEG